MLDKGRRGLRKEFGGDLLEHQPLAAAAWAAIAHFLRGRFVRDIGQVTLGMGLSQFALLVATPIILHLYGAAAFGLYATIQALASVLSGITALRIDVVIPLAHTKYRALRLVSAVVGLSTAAVLAEYGLIVVWVIFLADSFSTARNYAGVFIWWIPVVALVQTLFVVSRAWLLRSSAYKLVAFSQIARVTLFITLSVVVGIAFSRAGHHIHYGVLLLAQVIGDATAVAVTIVLMSRRRRRLFLPAPVWRPLTELRANWSLIRTTAAANLLAIFNQNIPVWVAAYVFGLQAAGWFSAAQRVVSAPVHFTISTVGAVFTQRVRSKRTLGLPIAGDIVRMIAILCVALSPLFGTLAWLAQSDHLGALGTDWVGAGPTLAATVLIAFGSVFHAATESVPFLFQFNRQIIAYHGARFAITLLISGAAIIGLLPYRSWIYWYAIAEMLLYFGNSAITVAKVRRIERS